MRDLDYLNWYIRESEERKTDTSCNSGLKSLNISSTVGATFVVFKTVSAHAQCGPSSSTSSSFKDSINVFSTDPGMTVTSAGQDFCTVHPSDPSCGNIFPTPEFPLVSTLVLVTPISAFGLYLLIGRMKRKI